jgi:hypothetical protein
MVLEHTSPMNHHRTKTNKKNNAGDISGGESNLLFNLLI